MNPKFQIGNIVRLISLSPPMVIQQIIPKTYNGIPQIYYECHWIDKTGVPQKEEYLESLLLLD